MLSGMLSMMAIMLTMTACGQSEGSGTDNTPPAEDETSAAEPLTDIIGPECLMGDEGLMEIRWFTEEAGDYQLVYTIDGEMTEAEPLQSKMADRLAWSVTLPRTDLTYYVTDGTAKTEDYAVRALADERDYAFTFLGDPQLVGDGSAEAYNEALGFFDDSDFALIAGDIVNNTEEVWEYDLAAQVPQLRTMPYASALGNHDDPTLYDFYFLPKNMQRASDNKGLNYAFSIGRTRFICLDSNNMDGLYHETFLREALAPSDYDWVIVYMHHSVFTPVNKLDYDAEDRKVLFADLFARYDVDLVLAGDDHFHARPYLMDGLTPLTDCDLSSPDKAVGQTAYLTAGSCSGSKFYTPENGLPDYICVAGEEKKTTAAQIHVTDKAITVTSVYTENGEVFDTFTLTRQTPRTALPAEDADSDAAVKERAVALSCDYILSCVLPNGAIARTPVKAGENSVNPYFADYAAMALLTQGDYAAVKDYIIWHFAHLNTKPDHNGLLYTIDDYHVTAEADGVGESAKGDYDSVDSYAASFLMLLEAYADETKDDLFIAGHAEEILGIINLLLDTVDDRLSVTKPDHPVKYLMDNSEVVRGLKAAKNVIDVLKDQEAYDQAKLEALRKTVKSVREDVKKGIDGLMCEDGMSYAWVMDEDGEVSLPDWTVFYPDSAAQMTPLIFGIAKPDKAEGQALYQNICDHWQWETMAPLENGASGSLWAMMAAGASVMNDHERINTYTRHFLDYAEKDAEAYLNVSETAWMILALTGAMR